jgi:hypothetical protein
MRLKSADLEDRVPAMLVVLGLFAGALALTVGTALGAAPPELVVLALAVLAPLPFILKDYRVGVGLLALVLPVMSMLPSVRGLNPVNYLVAATWLGFWRAAGGWARPGRGCRSVGSSRCPVTCGGALRSR